MGIPHFPQNLIEEEYSRWQRGQVTISDGEGEAAFATGGNTFSLSTLWKLRFPQRPQNFVPSAKREPHFTQATTAGGEADVPVRLSRLPPREGVNW